MCSIRRWQAVDFDETPDRERKACPVPERKAPLCLPPREPCRFRKLAEHTAQQVEHRERTIECQYLARLMRALAPIRNSNSSSMIPQHKACAGQSLHPNWGVRKRRWVQGRLDDQLSDSRRGGQAVDRRSFMVGCGCASLSVSVVARAIPGESGPLTKLIFPPAAAARRFAEFRCDIVTSWITVVFLVFSNTFEGARSIDQGFVNVARLRGNGRSPVQWRYPRP